MSSSRMGQATSKISFALKKEAELKKPLDKRQGTRYNELIKNGIDSESNPFTLTEKETSSEKKFLTRCQELGIMSSSRAGYGNLLIIYMELQL